MTNNQKINHPLQSKAWGEFRKAWGNKVIKIKDQQVVFSKIPHTPWTIGTSLKCPLPAGEIIEQLKILGRKERAIFIKLEPSFVKISKEQAQLLEKYCVKGKPLFTPTSFWIDLTKSEEELLKSFTSKTRYNIHLAQKKGVEVFEDNSNEAFETYINLTRETVQRQHFFAHNERYHRLMWQYLKPTGMAHLLVAKYKEEIITTWILFSSNQFLYYPYGASSVKHKEVMANNLMMWEAIKLGKKLGCTTFDLWGREPGKGFTRFKEGYNPKVVEFIGSWDLIINPFLYWLYRLLEYFRWFLLRIPARLGIIKPKF